MSKSTKIIVVFLFVLTVLLGSVAFYVANRLRADRDIPPDPSEAAQCVPAGGGIGDDGPGGCCGSYQCTDGTQGDSGGCRDWEVCDVSNGACASGTSCRVNEDQCLPEGGSCGSDNWRCCSGNCNNGTCQGQAPPPTGDECTSGAQCDPGQLCSNGTCVDDGQGGCCNPSAPGCFPGETCNGGNGACGGGTSCTSGGPGGACVRGSDCGGCEFPESGYCLYNPNSCGNPSGGTQCGCAAPNESPDGCGGGPDFICTGWNGVSCTPPACPAGMVSCGVSGNNEEGQNGCVKMDSIKCDVNCPSCNNLSFIHRYCRPAGTTPPPSTPPTTPPPGNTPTPTRTPTPTPTNTPSPTPTPTGTLTPTSTPTRTPTPTPTPTGTRTPTPTPTVTIPPFCGDGVCHPGETCDTNILCPGGGPMPNGTTCRVDCTYCGDGTQQPGEQCDDGNQNNDDGCSNQCTTPLPQTAVSGEEFGMYVYSMIVIGLGLIAYRFNLSAKLWPHIEKIGGGAIADKVTNFEAMINRKGVVNRSRKDFEKNFDKTNKNKKHKK